MSKEIETMQLGSEETEERGDGVSTLNYANACKRHRAFNIPLSETDQGENYYRAIIIKSTITNALQIMNRTGKQATRKEVMQYMVDRYCECGFKNYQQQQETVMWDGNRAMRYLRSENRKAYFPAGKNVLVGGKKIFVHPDVAFPCGDQITLALFKIGKPNGMTQTGRNNDFARDLQLYSMILYGRALGYKNITACFYFLRKDSDTTNWSTCEQNFFGGGGNIIQMTDLNDGTGEPNELDEQMAEKIALNDEGFEPEEIKEEHCEYCPLKQVCKYTLPPVKIQEE